MSEYKVLSTGRPFTASLSDFPRIPKISRPNLAASFIPVVGPAWEAAADIQDGKYWSAAFNAAMAVADATPIGVVGKGVHAVRALDKAKTAVEAMKKARGWTASTAKGAGIFQGGMESARDMSLYMRKAGLAKPGVAKAGAKQPEKLEEVHHWIELNGASRKEGNWRNHPAFLKVLPKETHRRLHGAFNDKPRFNAVQRAWIGSPDWVKAVPAGLLGYVADGVENVQRQAKLSASAPARR